MLHIRPRPPEGMVKMWILRLTMIAIGAVCVCAPAARPQNPEAGKAKTMHASGSFEIKMVPASESVFPRMTSDKQFSGDLEGTSKGEMLASGPPPSGPKGSGGYVAMERVTGKLGVRSGSFVLQHSSTMNRGVPLQSITVVPESGTGELAGLEGKMIIKIEGGRHY